MSRAHPNFRVVDQVVLWLRGEGEDAEYALDWLSDYRGSRPRKFLVSLNYAPLSAQQRRRLLDLTVANVRTGAG